QVSCTASSASASEPNIRYATALRWDRCSSNRSAKHSLSSIGHVLLLRSVYGIDPMAGIDVTEAMKQRGPGLRAGGGGGAGYHPGIRGCRRRRGDSLALCGRARPGEAAGRARAAPLNAWTTAACKLRARLSDASSSKLQIRRLGRYGRPVWPST